MKLVIATKNEGKMREIRAIFENTEFEPVSMAEMNIDVEVLEDGKTFAENSMKKAEEIMKLCNEITLADDSGLVVDALGGEPGIYSARYAHHGDDFANNIKLLKNMEGIKERSARFVCAISVAFPDGKRLTAEETFEGQIAHEMKGEGGFGYDVLFYLPEYKKTSAEIPAELKNKISHRAKALEKIKKLLTNG